MQMILINVRCDDRLHIVTKSLAEKCLCYLVGKLGCDVVIGSETLYVVDSL